MKGPRSLARNTPPDGLRKDRVARILEDLFVAGRVEHEDEVHGSRIPRKHKGEGEDLRTTEEDLRMPIEKCDPGEAAGVEGVPGEIFRIITEQRPGRLLDLLNYINRSGRIPTVWRVREWFFCQNRQRIRCCRHRTGR